MPDIIAEERAAVFREINGERAIILSDIDRQRIATLQEITAWANSEREIMFEEMARMVAEEREAVFADADDIALAVVDHIFLRLVQIGAVVAVLALVGVWLLRRGRTS
jgi:DNA-binding LacI/PurR family transcriptional regulator